MKDLNNKWVFVTGAGSGIGREICIAFAQQGCNIVATDIDRKGLDQTTETLRESGVQAHGYLLDVTNVSAYEQLSDTVIKSYGCPDILVNNAGIAIMADVLDTTAAMWSKTLNVNVMGVVNGTKAFLGAMKEKPSPSFVINIASVASRVPFPYMSAYAASKYAVEGFTDALRTELALEDSQVSAMSVHPGLIKTNIVPSEGENFTAQQIANVQAKYDNEGSDPSVVANDIVNAVRQDKACLMTGAQSTTAYWINQLLPKKIIAKLIARDVIKAGLVRNT